MLVASDNPHSYGLSHYARFPSFESRKRIRWLWWIIRWWKWHPHCLHRDWEYTLGLFNLVGNISKVFFLPLTTKLREGYVFKGVCDSVHRKGGMVSVQGCLCPGGCLCQGDLCPGGVLLGRPPAHMVMSRQYASYWNAFLLFIQVFLKHFKGSHLFTEGGDYLGGKWPSLPMFYNSN